MTIRLSSYLLVSPKETFKENETSKKNYISFYEKVNLVNRDHQFTCDLRMIKIIKCVEREQTNEISITLKTKKCSVN